MSWKLESLSAAIFVNQHAPTAPDAFSCWSSLFGFPPSGYQQAPGLMPPGTQAFGAVGVVQHYVTAQPGRLEVGIQRADGTFPVGEGYLDEQHAYKWLIEISSAFASYAETQGSPYRVATVGGFLKRAESSKDVAREFIEFVGPTNFDITETDLDLTFQINRRMECAHPKVQLNRLLTLSAGMQQIAQVVVKGPGQQAVTVKELHAIVAKIDVNNVVSERVFDVRELSELIAATMNGIRPTLDNGLKKS